MPTKKKRKTLPKDFEERLKSGADLASLQRVFETCEIDARGGYAHETALLMSNCPDDLARWLVTNGADVNAVDSYGRNALHIGARRLYKPRNLELLIKLGCHVGTRDHSGNSPLHAAVETKNQYAVKRLLAAGAEVNATNRDGLTPLEQGLCECSNSEIEPMVPVARALLKAGARRTLRMKDFVVSIGENFEFHRAAFAKDSVVATSKAMLALCQLFGVQPAPRRVIHDGKSVIEVNTGTWQRQHEELWALLVPSSGAAATVQGEVIRISGRIGDEISRNGGMNWDADYTKMSRAFKEFIREGQPLAENDLRTAGRIIDEIVEKRGAADRNYDRLPEFAVKWVRQNPQPFKLGKVAYKR